MTTRMLIASILILIGIIWVVRLPSAWRKLIRSIKNKEIITHPVFNLRTVSFEENAFAYIFSQSMSVIILLSATIVGVSLIYLGISNF